MVLNDLFELLCSLRPNMDRSYIGNIYELLLFHIETRVIDELMHSKQRFDPEHLLLRAPHDDVYWKYILQHLDLGQGNIDQYRVDRQLFEEAWERLSNRVFQAGGVLDIPDRTAENSWGGGWLP
jgi:hypothetical protein